MENAQRTDPDDPARHDMWSVPLGRASGPYGPMVVAYPPARAASSQLPLSQCTERRLSRHPAELPQEENVFYCFILFFGLFTSLLAFLVYMLETPIATLHLGDWYGGIPAVVLFPLLETVVLLATRLFACSLSTKRGLFIMWVVGLIGGCIAPYGLLSESLWFPAVVLMAFGVTAIMFLWWARLCSLRHRLLVIIASASFTAAGIIMALIGALELPPLAATVIGSAVMAAAWIVLVTIKDRDTVLEQLFFIDPHDSAKRLHPPYNFHLGQVNYFDDGFVFGVAMGLVYLLQLFGDPLAHVASTALLICVPVFIAGLVILVFHYLFDFGLERVTKDFFASSMAVAFISMPFLPLFWQGVCFVFLFTVVMLQLIMIASAIIELIRFEEISPLWYIAEFVHLFAGMACGILLAWVCSIGVWGSAGLLTCCSATVLVTGFAQVFINRVSYPDEQMYVRDTGVSPASSSEDAPRGGMSWKRKVDYVGDRYDLSPRQREILDLLARGRDVTYIVEHFHISRSTAKTHVYNIYRKLDIHSRQDLLDLIDEAALSDGD